MTSRQFSSDQRPGDELDEFAIDEGCLLPSKLRGTLKEQINVDCPLFRPSPLE